MVTVLEYLVIAAAIGLVVFVIAVFVFGRGEQMAPLSPRISPAELPDGVIAGEDVRRIRFGLALRGYRMSDVDWTLDRLADELDRLHRRVDELGGEPLPPGVDPAPDPDLFAGDQPEPDLAVVGASTGRSEAQPTSAPLGAPVPGPASAPLGAPVPGPASAPLGAPVPGPASAPAAGPSPHPDSESEPADLPAAASERAEPGVGASMGDGDAAPA